MTEERKKEISEYRKRWRQSHAEQGRSYSRQWYHDNKERVKKYKEDNKDKIKAYREVNKKHLMHKQRFYQIEKQYGITEDQYNELFSLQDGCCAICGTHQSDLKKSLFIDHNHITGNIRGLLCSKCNLAIGHLNDDIKLVKAAIKYLEENDKD